MNYYVKNGTHRSAGFKMIPISPDKPARPHGLARAAAGIHAIGHHRYVPGGIMMGQGETVLWVDDISLREAPVPVGMQPAPDPWVGLTHQDQKPLFEQLLTNQSGGYTTVCWTHNLNSGHLPENLKRSAPVPGAGISRSELTYVDSARNGLGYMDLPGGLKGESRAKDVRIPSDLIADTA